MKSYFVVMFFLLGGLANGADWHEQWDRSGTNWHEKWNKTLDSIESLPMKDKLEILGGALGVGEKSKLSEEEYEVFNRAQTLLLGMPGHAQYFADEIERYRELDKNLPLGQQLQYDRFRKKYIVDTLGHIPSPESVKILGRYLYDEKDVSPDVPTDAPRLSENAYLASAALSTIGLRNPPIPNRSGYMQSQEDIKKCRDWYEKVKLGTLPFSFKGQSLEFRLKSDGSVDSMQLVNSPDDGRKPSRVISADAVRADESSFGKWYWLAIPLMFVLGGFWFFRRKGAAA